MSRDRQECAVVADGSARRLAPALPYPILGSILVGISVYINTSVLPLGISCRGIEMVVEDVSG